MHPEIMRELASQRQREFFSRASEYRLARGMRKSAHARRGRAHAPAELATPSIPDYVDGMFREAERQLPSQRGSRGSKEQAGPDRRAA